MRTYVTLLKREILDHIAYFVGALVVTALIAGALISITLGLDPSDREIVTVGGLIPTVLVVVTGLCALGVAQMYTDRTRNISAFLTALPATRPQIFTARIAAGVLAVLILLIPVTIAAAVVLNLGSDEVPLYRGILPEMFLSVFLMCLACYGVGIYAGWNRGSLAPTLGVLPIVILVPMLVVIKGFGLDVSAILTLFTLACLTGTWCRFSASSL